MEVVQEKDKSLGLFVAGLKTSKDKVKDREAFVELLQILGQQQQH